MVGDAVSGAEFAPFLSPLPPASSRDGPVRRQLALLWTCSVPLLSKLLAVCSGRLIFSLSLLLSHSLSCYLRLAPSDCPQGTQAQSLPSAPLCCPHLLVVDVGVWGTFLLGVAFRHVICGFYLFFLPVRLPSEIRKLPPNPPVRGFPGVWKLPLSRLSSRDGSPSVALLSLYLSLIFCPTSF